MTPVSFHSTIQTNGWDKHCIWEHSATVKELYTRRCRKIEPEMDTAAQAVELLAPHITPGDRVLDAGCGSGYLFHSFQARSLPVEYFGIDAAPSLIAIGKSELPAFGLPAERLQVCRIEDLHCSVEHVVCTNVLSNIDNYHRPLERLLQSTKKSVVLRESCGATAEYLYVTDKFLDPGIELKVHVNRYRLDEVLSFIRGYGFTARSIVDRRTGGQPEMVIGYPHHWTFIEAVRT
jgi:SAM-dependent methyltransferase